MFSNDLECFGMIWNDQLAWRKWKFASKEKEFRLKDDEVQKPGHIPKKILKGLAEVVQNLPERKKYQRPAAK